MERKVFIKWEGLEYVFAKERTSPDQLDKDTG